MAQELSKRCGHVMRYRAFYPEKKYQRQKWESYGVQHI